MDSFMVGIDVRHNGRTRVSILEPAYDMTVETFSFPTPRVGTVLPRHLQHWNDVQLCAFELAICDTDDWPCNITGYLDPTWRLHYFDGARIADITHRAETILGCRLNRHRSKLLAFMLKYDLSDTTPAAIATQWALRMARDFLFAASAAAGFTGFRSPQTLQEVRP